MGVPDALPSHSAMPTNTFANRLYDAFFTDDWRINSALR